MKKPIKTALIVLLVLVLGAALVAETVLLLPTQFDNTYLAELAVKYRLLKDTAKSGEPRIIIIGGSSVAFGIDSALLSEELGYEVVNFGLYGPLGTTIMMDLTRGNLNEGDIVVLAPETDAQTMSMTFNGEGMWECCDSDLTMLFKIRAHNWGDMLSSFWEFASRKLTFYRYGKPSTDGAYDRDSFNERGDMIFEREGPDMDEWYDVDHLIDLDPSIVEEDFIDYVNEYTAYARRQGAEVVWSWPPMNELAVQQDEQERLAYASWLREELDCAVISNLEDYILPAGYFFDTNYHVNSRGVAVHTGHLLQDLSNLLLDGEIKTVEVQEAFVRGTDGRAMDPLASGEASGESSGEVSGETQTTEETEAEPTPTPTPVPEVEGSSRDAALFVYGEYNEGLSIVGVTDEGKQATELEIPWSYEGTKVLAIEGYAFEGCDKLETIRIQENLQRIYQHGFDGCPRLTSIYIDAEGQNVLVPGIDLFANVPSLTKVYVSAEHYGTFVADYFWGNYLDRLVMTEE